MNFKVISKSYLLSKREIRTLFALATFCVSVLDYNKHTYKFLCQMNYAMLMAQKDKRPSFKPSRGGCFHDNQYVFA